MFLEDPVDLFLLAPDDIPVIIPGLFPLPVLKGVVYTIFECGLELYVVASYYKGYGGLG